MNNDKINSNSNAYSINKKGEKTIFKPVIRAEKNKIFIASLAGFYNFVSENSIDNGIVYYSGKLSNVAYWDENTSDWPSRPAVGSGIHVEWRSVTDPTALPPSEAIPGDSWKRAPGSTTP